MHIRVHKQVDWGGARYDWLDTTHAFSFGSYYDQNRSGFGELRVFNNDYVAPGKGFGEHSHDNFEIVSIVLSGALRHTDSLGNNTVIAESMVQAMTAGKGVSHAEQNDSEERPVHFIQLWIEPNTENLDPRHEEKEFDQADSVNKLQLLVAPSSESHKDVCAINQDAYIYRSQIEAGSSISHATSADRGTFIFVVSGEIDLEDSVMEEGDCAEITDANVLSLTAQSQANIILIDLPLKHKELF